jgi:hypothetical protein
MVEYMPPKGYCPLRRELAMDGTCRRFIKEASPLGIEIVLTSRAHRIPSDLAPNSGCDDGHKNHDNNPYNEILHINSPLGII